MRTPHGECRSEEDSAEETWSEDPKETVLPEVKLGLLEVV